MKDNMISEVVFMCKKDLLICSGYYHILAVISTLAQTMLMCISMTLTADVHQRCLTHMFPHTRYLEPYNNPVCYVNCLKLQSAGYPSILQVIPHHPQL